jgi:SHR-binding domain of vacuolar-sorting associated protein 13
MVVEAKKKAILLTRKTKIRGRETLFDSLLRGHKNGSDETQIFVQFTLKEAKYSWSGPVCVTSIGRFFVKLRQPLDDAVMERSDGTSSQSTRFASVHAVEENNSLVLRYTMPPDCALPYRIENRLHGSSVMYFQKV